MGGSFDFRPFICLVRLQYGHPDTARVAPVSVDGLLGNFHFRRTEDGLASIQISGIAWEHGADHGQGKSVTFFELMGTVP